MFLLTYSATGLVAEEASKKKLRRYDDGPLRLEEFRRDVPGSLPGRAYTRTRVLFTYDFQVKQLADHRFEARLDSLKTFSIFLRDESWWNHPDSTRLLDHEQGHFDIAEIAARRVQLAFHRLFQEKQTLTARARTLALARKSLADKLEKVIKVANDQAIDDNKAYDQRTLHGAKTATQAEFRRVQSLTLERLAKELGRKPQRQPTSKSSSRNDGKP